MNSVAKRFACLVVALLVSGCSGAPFAPGASTGAASNREIPNTGGGAFTATYSGSSTFSDCTATGNGYFKFRGKGKATYLNRSIEAGKLTGTRSGSHCVWSGNVTLRSRHHSKNSVTISLGLNGDRYNNPCNSAPGFVVKRGTGKFLNASGYGTVTFSCSISTYSDAWNGTLNY
jgi:hypothetical protein